LKASLYREIQAAQAGHSPDLVENGANLYSTTAAFHVENRGRRPPGRSAPPTPRVESKTCVFCKGQHWHTECVVVSDIEKRRDSVKHSGLCFTCLREKHRVHDCLSKGRCHICGQKHHTALCYNTEKQDGNTDRKKDKSHREEKPPSTSVSDDTHRFFTPTASPVLLKPAVGTIESDAGTAVVNILLDEGAQRSFVTKNVADRLGIHTNSCKHENINLPTFGSQRIGVKRIPGTTVKLITREGHVQITALVVDKISSPVKNYATAAIDKHLYLQNLPLAEQVKFDIDLLVGADFYWKIVENKVVRGSGPTAVDTKLGYMLSGPTNLETENTGVYNTMCLKIITDTLADTTQLANYWDLDTIGIHDDVTAVNKKCQFEQFRDENLHIEDGKYTAKLPWRDDHPPLPTN
jgi:hypothetical protein